METYEDDFDVELTAPKPYLTPQTHAQLRRRPQGYAPPGHPQSHVPAAMPLSSMPSSSVETLPPTPGASPLTAPEYRARALESLQQASNQDSSDAERQALVEFQRGRYNAAGPDMAFAGLMGEFGGEMGREWGGQILKHAIAARSPMQVEGGLVTPGGFVADPQHAARNRAVRLETQARLYESMAHNAETVEQRRAAALAADETRREAIEERRRADIRHDETRREIAANRPRPQEPLIQVWDPATQQTTYMPRSQAVGMQAPPRAGFAGPKMPADIARMNIGIRALEKTLDELEAELKTFGPRTGAQLNPEQRARMTSTAKRVQLEAKEMFQLGALTGPDMGMLEGVLADPTSWKGVMYGSGGLNEQLKSMRSAVQARKGAIQEQYGTGLPGAGAGRGAPPPGAVQRLD